MFGYIRSTDRRDTLYSMTRLLGSVQIDRPCANKVVYATGCIMNQGSTRMCVGYTFAQWLQSAPLITVDGPDAETIYTEAQRRDEIPYPHEGTTLRAALKYLKETGRIASYLWAFDVPTMVDWILKDQGTIVMGTPWYKGMNTLDNHGVLSLDGPIIDGHAYLVSGYDQERHLFRIVNSWGTEWGDYGEAWVRGDDMSILLAAGEACCGVEQNVEASCQAKTILTS